MKTVGTNNDSDLEQDIEIIENYGGEEIKEDDSYTPEVVSVIETIVLDNNDKEDDEKI